MVRGLYTAAAGALVAQMQADTIANNLANVNTAGFKRALLQVQSAPELQIYRKQTDPTTGLDGNVAATSSNAYVGALGTGAQVMDTPAVFAQGTLKQTGNPLDLAINGNGFFTIRTPQGVRYTRDGEFARDPQGNLVTMDGNLVLGQGAAPIQLQAGTVQIGADGTVTQNGQTVAQLQITAFGNPTAVRPEGDDRFVNTGAGQPATDTTSTVHQGYLEGSNASVVRSMVDLISAQRWFEANMKMIQTQDTANGYAIANVGRTNTQ